MKKIPSNARPHNVLDWWNKKVKGQKPLILCDKCGAVYYDEHWHTNPKMSALLKGQKGINREMCAECKWSKDAERGNSNFEGEVILKNIAAEEREELLNLVRNIGKRAVKRDPEDRIIKIEEKGNTARVLTTENQLAVSIGKQVDRAFKGGKLEIKWSDDDQVARAVWTHK